MKPVILLMLAALVLVAAPRRHALIVGIGRYPAGNGIPSLEGPPEDASALAAVLENDYGFLRDDIKVLRDGDATRAAILRALDDVISRVNEGDYLLFYYSGHGTSPQDLASRDLPIDGDTGAIIPADFRPGTPAQIAERLIVGRRDLRPRLRKLDGRVTVFGLLDTCFSANLMRGLRPEGTGKGVPLTQLSSGPSAFSMDEEIRRDLERVAGQHVPDPYPYKTVAWISAALAGQQAMDIDSAVLRRNRQATVDGKPHGAMTNALLIGLRSVPGAAGEGMSHAELYDFLLRQSMAWSHQPAWSANEANRQFAAAPAFGGRAKAIAAAPAIPQSSSPTVSIEGGPPSLRSRVASLIGVSLRDAASPEVADLTVRAESGGFRIYARGGVPVTESVVTSDDVVGRIAAEPALRTLLTGRPAGSSALGMAAFEGSARTHKGLFLAGDRFDLSLSTEKDGWPLVVNVDVTGYVTVLYPTVQSAAPLTAEGGFRNIGESAVSCPCGAEFLRAFVFSQKPAGYEAWAGAGFSPLDPRLSQLVSAARVAAGDGILRIITNSRKTGASQ